MANVQTLRLRHPENAQEKENPYAPTPVKLRHTGILQDQLRRCVLLSCRDAPNTKMYRRAARPPWTPSFSTAVRILLLVRVSAAMYSNIQDCDEGV